MSDQFSIEWVDRGYEPQNPADPDYPDGVYFGFPIPGRPSCKVDLPYPAKRCGLYVVRCRRCGIRIGITTAGRRDDPRSVTFICHPPLH